MDKITSGIIDKLSIIGLFNFILSGGVVLYGISPILDRYTPGIFYLQLGLEQNIEKAIVSILLCFIIGCALQGVQEYVFKGLKSRVVYRCLATAAEARDDKFEAPLQAKGLLGNKYRRQEIIELAKRLFAEKNLTAFDPEDREMVSYFVDYCEYSNSVKGYSSKASRMSESATFYEQLAIAFFALDVIGILVMIFMHSNVLIYMLGYLVMGALFTSKAYKCRLGWARAVLATYEAVNDHENKQKRMATQGMPQQANSKQ